MKRNLHREGWLVAAIIMLILAGAGVMTFWPFQPETPLAGVSAAFRGALIVCLFAIASGVRENVSRFQRAGAALAGSLMTITIQTLLLEDNPNQTWAAIGVTLGLLMFFLPFAGPSLWSWLARIGDERAARRRDS